MHRIAGHHHISMITKRAIPNNRFYQEVLGLRRVKVTVNQDEPSMYHLFYGDKTGSPGTELSFFEIPKVGRTYRGTNAITRIGLLVPSEASLRYWEARFDTHGVTHDGITTYAGHRALPFEDPEGLRLVLLLSNGQKVDHWETWSESDLPDRHQIQGMGSVEMTVRDLDALADTLTGLFGYTEVSRTDQEAVFQSVEGEVFGEIVGVEQDGPAEKPGRGSVHHLAIRVQDDEALAYWEEKVREWGFQTAGIVDRYYFKSLYFKETNGIVFEIATDGSGFAIDGNGATLGEQLDLPPFLEGRRKEIERKLTPFFE
ncbi:ring-cleaving dioxygenase [Salisediminibacterium selenitireducens]|nr:ring-cleaving dioxygenase [Salisediminibacterium selenitireducens]